MIARYFGSIRLDCLAIFNLFMHFANVIFSKESKNNNDFFQKKLFKKLFNFEVIFFLFNTDETRTLNFRMIYMLIEYFMLLFMIPVES